MKSRRIFKLFSCCHITNGVNRALILDSQRGVYHLIPLSLSNILNEFNGQSIDYVKSKFDEDQHSIVDSYFEFLEQNELIFFCDESMADYFPNISCHFEIPCQVSNAIIMFKQMDLIRLENIVEQLSMLNCQLIEINIQAGIEYSGLIEVLEICKKNEVDNVSLLLGGDEFDSYVELKKTYPCLNSIFFYNNVNESVQYFEGMDLKVSWTKKDLANHANCGVVADKYFAPNLLHYNESIHFNSCLNLKISVDTDGNIKNCPSMSQDFGNIENTTLKDALNKPGFKQYWTISKDKIDKCKGCEFRYICTDCRAYLENPGDVYSAPLKCGYDPETCKWEDWSKNPLKQNAIDLYGMRMIIDA